jgi:hypothetical protein
MRLFRSSKDTTTATTLQPHVAEQQNDGLDSKAEAVTAIRTSSTSKDKQVAVKAKGEDNAAAREAEDESKYPTGVKHWLLVLGLCLAIWLVALDNSIIATASRSF